MASSEVVGGAQFMSRDEAVRALGVKPQTLFAYVSRGLVQSTRDPAGNQRLYRRSDIERVRLRTRINTGPLSAPAGARLGQPLIETSVTKVSPQGPRYRGERAAVDLAANGRTFEHVADFLWTGRDANAAWPAAYAFPASVHAVALQLTHPSACAMVNTLSLYALRSLAEPGAGDSLHAARRLLKTLSGCFGYLSRKGRYRPPRTGESIAHSVLAGCGLETDAASLAAINAVLVLLADDELAEATFAARVGASYQADLYSCIVCALQSSTGWVREYAALRGLLDGVQTRDDLRRRVEAFTRNLIIPPGLDAERSRSGNSRTLALLELAGRYDNAAAVRTALLAFLRHDAGRLKLQTKPIIGLHVLAEAMRLPHGTVPALCLFARCAGWIAHSREQRASGLPLLPRARYVERPVIPDEETVVSPKGMPRNGGPHAGTNVRC